jgi:alkylhydroperoxidase family enzyme
MTSMEGDSGMALVPLLDDQDLADEHRQKAQRYIGRVLNFHRVVGHSPEALEGFLGLSNALRKMRLDRRLRELAYLRAAQVNHCQY